MILFLALENNGKNKSILLGHTSTCSHNIQTVLSAKNHDDLGHGTCRNCGVRPADGSDKKCSVCRMRGY